MDALTFLRAIGALAITLALLVGFAMLLRRYGHKLGGFAMPTVKPAERRLHLVEALPLDPRHRLMLVRVDGTEQLLVLGPNGASFAPRPEARP